MAKTNETTDSQIKLHWFLPPFTDSRGIVSGGHGSGTYDGTRTVDLPYLQQLALAAESNGIQSVLIPTGAWCEEPFAIATSLISTTKKLNFLVAHRPGLQSPLATAQSISTVDFLSEGRLRINIVAGGEDKEQKAYGDSSTKEQRYERTDEFLEILDTLLYSDEPINHKGEYFELENAQLARPLEHNVPIFFGGSSKPAGQVAGRWADNYLTWGEPPAAVAEKTKWIEQEAKDAGREGEVAQGIRLHVIARETSEQAWAEAQRLLDGVDPEKVRTIQQRLAQSQSEGQRRMAELHGKGTLLVEGKTSARDLEIYPGLWAGIGLLRGGAGTALVGSYDEVAELIAEYYEKAGTTDFILSGYPHLEEINHIGDGVIPALQARGLDVAHA